MKPGKRLWLRFCGVVFVLSLAVFLGGFVSGFFVKRDLGDAHFLSFMATIIGLPGMTITGLYFVAELKLYCDRLDKEQPEAAE